MHGSPRSPTARSRRLLEAGAAAREAGGRGQARSTVITARTTPGPIDAEAVIVSTARTPLAKSWRGAFNMTHGATLGGHVVAARGRARRLEPGEVEDVSWAARSRRARPAGTSRARSRCAPGCRSTTAGVDRQPLLLVGPADDRDRRAARDRRRGPTSIVAGGVESISCVQNEMNRHMLREDPWLVEHKPEIYWPMLQTAEIVAKRYGISREAQDEYGVRSQQRAAAAARGGQVRRTRSCRSRRAWRVADKATGARRPQEVTLAADEGIRADTTYEGVAKIKPAMPGGVDRRGQREPVLRRRRRACVVMDAQARRAARPRSRSASSAASRSPAASRTRWASARCSRCRSCWSAPA